MFSLPVIIEKTKSLKQWNNEINYCTLGYAIIVDLVSNGHVSKLKNRNWPITGLHFCLRYKYNKYYNNTSPREQLIVNAYTRKSVQF